MARAPSKKKWPVSGSVTGAIEAALEELQSLRDDFQEIVDNTSEGLQQTEKHQTRSETVDALNNFVDEDTLELPDDCGETVVNWIENRLRPSRSARRDNAVSALTAARDGVEEWIEQEKTSHQNDPDWDESDIEAASEAMSTIDDWLGYAEGCEFPGMFG